MSEVHESGVASTHADVSRAVALSRSHATNLELFGSAIERYPAAVSSRHGVSLVAVR